MEMRGIDPRTSRMLSERSTIWATSPIWQRQLNVPINSTVAWLFLLCGVYLLSYFIGFYFFQGNIQYSLLSIGFTVLVLQRLVLNSIVREFKPAISTETSLAKQHLIQVYLMISAAVFSTIKNYKNSFAHTYSSPEVEWEKGG